MEVEIELDIAGDQIDGDRDYQEDSFLTTRLDSPGGDAGSAALLIMADGMGGHAAGNVASDLVVQAFNEHVTAHFGESPVPDILRTALEKSNESIRAGVEQKPENAGMGCTVVSAVIEQGQLWWVSVGDSHLYMLRDGELSKLNADHSYGGYIDRMQALGTPVEPDPDLARNMLISAVMGEDLSEVDCQDFPLPLQAGDRLIISSDGLDTLPDHQLHGIAQAAESADDCVQALLQAVKDTAKRRQDNTTVLVCDAVAREREAAAPVEPTTPPGPQPDPYDMRERAPEPAPAARTGKGGRATAIIVPLLIVAAGVAAWLFLDLDDAGEPTGGTTTVEPEPAAEPDTDADAQSQAAPTETATPAHEFEKFRDTLQSGGFGPQMVRLPAGTFLMGDRTSTSARERPQHEVEVAPFAMSVYEVTFSEYDRFARATGRGTPDSMGLDRDTHPVFGVSWHDAVAYTEWLSRETGHAYSLPSESQWEYAASAGTVTAYWWGRRPGEGNAHCFRCNPGMPENRPIAVGSFDASPFELHDTAGNVAEWVMDCFHGSYEGAPADGSVWEGGDCSVRVVRGGHFASPNPNTRSRDTRDPDQGYQDVGIRVIREP